MPDEPGDVLSGELEGVDLGLLHAGASKGGAVVEPQSFALFPARQDIGVGRET
jgi:hypothetical protein